MLPKPSQVGQAPMGLLNENKRGSSSASEYSQAGHANLAENRCSLSVSISSAMALPSAKRNAVSKDSAIRCFMSCFTLIRSTTTSTLCLVVLVNCGKASISKILPSMRKRTKPCAFSSSNKSSCSPLRLLTTGANIMSLVSSGSINT